MSLVLSAFLYLVLTCLALWLLYFRLGRKRLYELAAKIPGPKGLPIIGHAHLMLDNFHNIFINIYTLTTKLKEGSPLKIWIGPRLLVFLTDPRDAEIIFSSHVHIDKAPEYKLFEPWLGDGLLISTGEKWRKHRKIIAPTFHLNVLKSFIGLFNDNSRSIVERMRQEGCREFDVHHYMGAVSVDILLETVMGVDKKTQAASSSGYAEAVIKMCEILHLRHTRFWLRPDFLFKLTHYAKDQLKYLDFIHKVSENVIAEKKALFQRKNKIPTDPNTKLTEVEEAAQQKTETEMTNVDKDSYFNQSLKLEEDLNSDNVGEKKRQAFLDLMLEYSETEELLTDKEIREEVDTIMFEGHDTTAAASSFFLCIMGARPNIQEKVVEELESIFGDSDRAITFEDTLEMKYTERCILETLRLYPPVPLAGRELQEEVELSSEKVTLPAKCTVIVGVFRLHRLPTIYPNPDEFNPDHFLPEVSSARHYYAYTPFGAGPRSCVGRKYAMLKLKIVLATVLRNFKVSSSTKEHEWPLQADIILKRSDGFPISLTPRVMRSKASKAS